MSVSVLNIFPNRTTIQATHVATPNSVPKINTDVTIFTGTVICVFRGDAEKDASGEVTRDELSFNLPDIESPADLRIDIASFLGASGTVSLTSFAFDGVVNNALWAVDDTSVFLTNLDSGTGRLHFPRKDRTCGDRARRRERRFFDTDT